MNRRVVGRLSLGIALAVLLNACAATPQQGAGTQGTANLPATIVIGATLPLTGTESRLGGFYKEGYDLAFEIANKDGGLKFGDKRVPVQLTLLDDTTKQDIAVSLADKLINSDRVHFLLGTYSTSLVQAQTTVAEQNAIPYVNGGGAAAEIYSRGYKWIFGNLAPVNLLADTMMQWIDEQQGNGKLPKPSKIALVWENTSHGQDFKKGVSDFVAKKSDAYQIVVNEPFQLDGKDFSALLNKVKAANADFFLSDAHLPDYLTMQRQYVQTGLCHKVISYGARGPERQAITTLGKDANYIVSAVWWNAQMGSQGLNKDFVTAFKAKYNKEPEWYHAVSYEAARALFTAIQQAGSIDREAVRQKLAALKIESILPGGQLSFPKEHGQQAFYPFVVQQNMPDGKAPIIFPKDAATAQGIAPNPNCAR